jgi:hypothetical protein
MVSTGSRECHDQDRMRVEMDQSRRGPRWANRSKLLSRCDIRDQELRKGESQYTQFSGEDQMRNRQQ